MKKYLNIYLVFLALALAFTSCLKKEIPTITPNLAAVTNLKYVLVGDSVKLTWTLPASASPLNVTVSPDPKTIIPLNANATTYTFGIVEVNKPYLYTVKVSDSNGNTSLGSSVQFVRAGASPIKNAEITQVDANLLISWQLPDSAITSIVLVYADKTVTLAPTATSFQIQNAAVGSYHFTVRTTNNRNQVSNPTFLDLKMGATMLGYLSDLPDSTTMMNTADDDIVAGAQWFFSTYPKARFISFNAIKNGTVDLSQYRVLWWNYDIDDGTSDLPPISLDQTVLTKMITYHKNGGNLLLSTYAIAYLWDMGRMTINYTRGIDKGPGGLNPDVWGVGVNIDKKHDQSGHPLYKGIAMTTQADGRITFPVIGNGWKENHNYILVVPTIYNLGNGDELAYTRFTTDNNAVWLGQWDGIGDYFMAGIFELQPKDDFQGSSISIGIGGIEWKVNSGINPYQSTINKLYQNAIDYLKTK